MVMLLCFKNTAFTMPAPGYAGAPAECGINSFWVTYPIPGKSILTSVDRKVRAIAIAERVCIGSKKYAAIVEKL